MTTRRSGSSSSRRGDCSKSHRPDASPPATRSILPSPFTSPAVMARISRSGTVPTTVPTGLPSFQRYCFTVTGRTSVLPGPTAPSQDTYTSATPSRSTSAASTSLACVSPGASTIDFCQPAGVRRYMRTSPGCSWSSLLGSLGVAKISSAPSPSMSPSSISCTKVFGVRSISSTRQPSSGCTIAITPWSWVAITSSGLPSPSTSPCSTSRRRSNLPPNSGSSAFPPSTRRP